MDEARNMILADALSVAIESEKKVIKYRRIIGVLIVVICIMGMCLWIRSC